MFILLSGHFNITLYNYCFFLHFLKRSNSIYIHFILLWGYRFLLNVYKSSIDIPSKNSLVKPNIDRESTDHSKVQDPKIAKLHITMNIFFKFSVNAVFHKINLYFFLYKGTLKGHLGFFIYPLFRFIEYSKRLFQNVTQKIFK